MNPRRAFLAALAVALLVATDSARGQCFTEFRASPGSGPEGITTGPDMNLWFTEFDAGSIARILPSTPNTITEFNVSMADIRPAGIAAGPDGNLWFVEITGNRVGRITPLSPNTITEFPIPTAGSGPQEIVAGPDGNLWFTEGLGAKIGRITPGSPNTITEFPVPSGQGAQGITVGPDGNIWFAESFVAGNEGGNRIGRITPGSPNTITEFPIPTANGSPGGITVGPDGNLWFTEVTGNSIGRITPGAPNTITEFPIPRANTRPFTIATGPDGNLWFTEAGVPGGIGRILAGQPQRDHGILHSRQRDHERSRRQPVVHPALPVGVAPGHCRLRQVRRGEAEGDRKEGERQARVSGEGREDRRLLGPQRLRRQGRIAIHRGLRESGRVWELGGGLRRPCRLLRVAGRCASPRRTEPV